MKTTLSLSGGKDSTFLLLELIRRGTPPAMTGRAYTKSSTA